MYKIRKKKGYDKPKHKSTIGKEKNEKKKKERKEITKHNPTIVQKKQRMLKMVCYNY